jgi:photoactive yellow protein
MIESMESQLDDLYADKQSLGDVRLQDTEEQSTFQQLEALYAERQRLQEALGISDADDIIEMVETLTSQLEDLYTGRDETLAPEERHEAQLWSPDAAGPDAEPSDPGAAEADAPAVRSVERQLEALYREKETLLREGFAGADEVVGRLRSQRRRIEALRREKQACERWLDRLRSTVGAETILQALERVRALASEADAPLAEMDAAPADADVEVHLGAAPPVLDRETLERLDEMSAEELEALEVGAVRLRDDGTVAALNDAALRLPELRTVEDRAAVVGEHFFRDLVPSTNTALFVDRVRAGQRRGELDARFPFTFAGPDEAPRSFAVHLYRSPERDTTWLLFRPS